MFANEEELNEAHDDWSFVLDRATRKFDKLPPESDLALKLHVNTLAVKEAIKSLEEALKLGVPSVRNLEKLILLESDDE